MKKPRILFLISFNFQIRYLIRTGFIEKVKEFCEPVVCLAWKQKDLCEELDILGVEYFIEDSLKSTYEINLIRNNLDSFHKLKSSKNFFYKNIRKLNRHRFSLKKRIKYDIKLLRDRIFFTWHRYNLLKIEEQRLIESEAFFSNFSNTFIEKNISGVFTLSPFLFFEEMICRVANKIDVPIYYSVLSFDNLSNRGEFRFKAEKYFVWNELNKSELVKLLGERDIENKIDIVGVPQFDFYYKDTDFIKPKDEWKYEKGILPDRPVLLYGANSKSFVTNEQTIIKKIDEAIITGLIINQPIVLVRPHPTDSLIDWEEFIEKCENVLLEKSIEENESLNGIYNKFSNFSMNDIVRLSSSLANSDVHLSIASTMALDGSVFNKAIVCPYFSPNLDKTENEIIRGFYWSDHYKPITQSGAIMLPRNYDELYLEINNALLYPNRNSEKRKELLNKMIYINDGKATERLVNAFKKCIKNN